MPWISRETLKRLEEAERRIGALEVGTRLEFSRYGTALYDSSDPYGLSNALAKDSVSVSDCLRQLVAYLDLQFTVTSASAPKPASVSVSKKPEGLKIRTPGDWLESTGAVLFGGGGGGQKEPTTPKRPRK